MAEPRHPRHASTVIVLRPDRAGKFELFLTRRPQQMKFLGGFYVFPGGKVTREDASKEMLQRCTGLSLKSAQAALEAELSPQLCLAHWVAGVREVFEEVGILLCVTETGEPVDMQDAERRRRLARKRTALVAGAIGFIDLLQSEGLYCDVGRLAYFSRRITPEIYSMRFDVRFFLAVLPRGQRPLFTSEEVAETLWITPERALEQFDQGWLPVIRPTLVALTALREFGSWQALVSRYQLK